jgi:phosphoglycerate dehydrogenase-like enzyme
MSDEPLRILVHGERTDTITALTAERFPQAQISACSTYEGLADTVAKSNPHAAYTEVFARMSFPREALFSGTALRFIHVSGAGINHLAPWDAKEVSVCNVAGIQDEGMAQFALARLIAIKANFFTYHDQQKQRLWKTHDALSSTGGTLTVVGLGHIGQACAKLANQMGMTVYGVRARPQPCEGVEEVVAPDRMHEVLAKSDYVIIVTPLTEQTRGLVGRDAIAAMKPGVIIHNMARGHVMDETALIEALNSGHVRAASLDVFAEEPLSAENPLWNAPNLYITPHIGGLITYADYDRQSTEVFLDNLGRFVAGEALVNVTDPERGY